MAALKEVDTVVVLLFLESCEILIEDSALLHSRCLCVHNQTLVSHVTKANVSTFYFGTLFLKKAKMHAYTHS